MGTVVRLDQHRLETRRRNIQFAADNLVFLISFCLFGVLAFVCYSIGNAAVRMIVFAP